MEHAMKVGEKTAVMGQLMAHEMLLLMPPSTTLDATHDEDWDADGEMEGNQAEDMGTR